MGKIVGAGVEGSPVRADAAKPYWRVAAGHSGFSGLFTVVYQGNYNAIGACVEDPLEPHGLVPGDAGHGHGAGGADGLEPLGSPVWPDAHAVLHVEDEGVEAHVG